jgi:hypothetical protein
VCSFEEGEKEKERETVRRGRRERKNPSKSKKIEKKPETHALFSHKTLRTGSDASKQETQNPPPPISPSIKQQPPPPSEEQRCLAFFPRRYLGRLVPDQFLERGTEGI